VFLALTAVITPYTLPTGVELEFTDSPQRHVPNTITESRGVSIILNRV